MIRMAAGTAASFPSDPLVTDRVKATPINHVC
jgi:hypothetical protein